MLKPLIAVALLISVSTAAIADDLTPEPTQPPERVFTEAQYQKYDQKLEKLFEGIDNHWYSSHSDYIRRVSGKWVCEALDKHKPIGNLYKKTNDADYDQFNQKVIAASVDTLCTEYRSDYYEYQKKLTHTSSVKK